MTSQDGRSFFELVPAEIRDQIYDATMFQNIHREKVIFKFMAPCPHLRLVSRQFKDEYDARSEWGTNLEVSFRRISARQLQPPNAPGLALRYTSIRLNCLLGKHTLICKRSDWDNIAFACKDLILQLAPEGLQHVEVYLVWDSVCMLKDYASQRSTRFLNRLNYLIQNPAYNERVDVRDSGIVFDLKLRYGGLPLLNTAMRSKCDVLGAERLKEPVTLGVWSAKDGYFQLDDDRTDEYLRMETVVEAAIQAASARVTSSVDAEMNISEDQIWQEEVRLEQL